jgi:CHAD domain-containing protein
MDVMLYENIYRVRFSGLPDTCGNSKLSTSTIKLIHYQAKILMKTEAQAILMNPFAQEATVQDAHQSLTLEQIITNQFETLRRHLKAAQAADDVEVIHKLRVTTRKLQASLDLLQFGEASSGARRSKRMLRNMRRKLSEVRNLDVFLSLLDQEAASRRALHDPFASLRKELQLRREKRAVRIHAFLESVSLKSLAKPISLKPVDSAACESQDKVAANSKGFHFAHPLDNSAILHHMANRLDQRLLEFQMLAAQALPTTHPEELHQLRIAAKRLRYLLEIASEMGYGKSLAALNWLRAIQDKIGDWHDLEAIENEIIRIAARKKFIKQHLEEASAILSAAVHFQKKKRSLVKHLFPVKIHRHLESTANRVAKTLRQASQS